MIASRLSRTARPLAFALLPAFVFHGVASAGDAPCPASSCPVAAKVTALLAEWDAAAATARSLSDTQRAQVSARIATAKTGCPVGCRLGETLVAVEDVLGIVIAADTANATRCALASAGAASATASKSDDPACAAACADAKALITARSHALRLLQQLAGHAANVATGACCDASSTAATTIASTSSSKPCAETCAAASSASCPIRVASRLGALGVSWDTALREATALPVATRRELVAGMHALAADSKSVALVPPSVAALAEGFDALDAVDAKLTAWAQANPEIAKTVPDEIRQSMALQHALIAETRPVLSRVVATIATMVGEQTTPAASVETASTR